MHEVPKEQSIPDRDWVSGTIFFFFSLFKKRSSKTI